MMIAQNIVAHHQAKSSNLKENPVFSLVYQQTLLNSKK